MEISSCAVATSEMPVDTTTAAVMAMLDIASAITVVCDRSMLAVVTFGRELGESMVDPAFVAASD